MRIVVLDGYTLNPGDLDWGPLRELGDCEIYERSSAAEVAKRAEGAEVIIINKVVVDRALMDQLPKLRYIGVLATGYNVVDVAAARERGIPVTNVPTYGTRSVAQMAFALLLELAAHVGHHSGTVREGRWTRNPDFCYWDYPLIELDGLTMGIVGFGRIGQATARIAEAFGMKVIAAELGRAAGTREGEVNFVTLDELFKRADVVSLHCPLTPETQGLVNAARLGQMKRSAFLINTSRGPLVEDKALAEALNSGRIAGAGLDVLSVEPPPAANPLLQAKNCIITPHIAWASRAARQRLMDIAVANVRAFLEGKPQNVVNA